VQSVVDRSSRTWCSGRTEPQTASSYRIIEASSEPSGTSRKPTEVRHRALASLSESTSEYQVRTLTTRGWLIAIRIKRGHRPRPRRSGCDDDRERRAPVVVGLDVHQSHGPLVLVRNPHEPILHDSIPVG
jgi:hypothetical protein